MGHLPINESQPPIIKQQQEQQPSQSVMIEPPSQMYHQLSNNSVITTQTQPNTNITHPSNNNSSISGMKRPLLKMLSGDNNNSNMDGMNLQPPHSAPINNNDNDNSHYKNTQTNHDFLSPPFKKRKVGFNANTPNFTHTYNNNSNAKLASKSLGESDSNFKKTRLRRLNMIPRKMASTGTTSNMMLDYSNSYYPQSMPLNPMKHNLQFLKEMQQNNNNNNSNSNNNYYLGESHSLPQYEMENSNLHKNSNNNSNDAGWHLSQKSDLKSTKSNTIFDELTITLKVKKKRSFGIARGVSLCVCVVCCVSVCLCVCVCVIPCNIS